MRKGMLVVGIFLVLAVALCVSAYADNGGGVSAWEGFWNSFGGFLYNALPWNWGSWAGK